MFKELFQSYLTCHLHLGCLSQAGVAKQLFKFLPKIRFHEAQKKIADSGSQALQLVRTSMGLWKQPDLLLNAQMGLVMSFQPSKTRAVSIP